MADRDASDVTKWTSWRLKKEVLFLENDEERYVDIPVLPYEFLLFITAHLAFASQVRGIDARDHYYGPQV